MKLVVFTNLDGMLLDLTTCEWLPAHEVLLDLNLSNRSLVFAFK